MKKKRFFDEPELDVIHFNAQDIFTTTSGGSNIEDDETEIESEDDDF